MSMPPPSVPSAVLFPDRAVGDRQGAEDVTMPPPFNAVLFETVVLLPSVSVARVTVPLTALDTSRQQRCRRRRLAEPLSNAVLLPVMAAT